MILMLPAHGSQPLHAQAPGGGAGGRGGGGGQAAAGGPIQSIDARTAGMQKIDGFYPLYWDERSGSMFVEIPEARHRHPDEHRPRGRARLERHRPRSRHRRRRQDRLVPARRSARADGAAEHVVPFEQRQPARAQVGRRLVRQVGALGLRGRGREQRARADRRHRLPAARRHRRRQLAAARHLPGRPDAQRVLSAADESVPEEQRNRNDADLRQRRRRRTRRRWRRPDAGPRPDSGKRRRPRRRRWRTRRRSLLRLGRQRDADGRSGDAARAPLVRRIAGQQLQAALRRSARRLRRPHLRRLQRADRRDDADALHPASSHREEGSERGDQRTGQADRVLGRSRRAGRRQEGAGGRRQLVERRRSRRPASATASRSRCCPTAPIRWTSATT